LIDLRREIKYQCKCFLQEKNKSYCRAEGDFYSSFRNPYTPLKGNAMANFNDAIVKTLAREGGAKFTDVPADKGGATKYGISQAAYPNVDIRNLTEPQARDIYKRDYWDRVRGDDLKSQVIAEAIFDTAVNMGVRTTSRMVQHVVGIEPADGILGSASLAVINKVAEKDFVPQFALAKIAYYASICNKDYSQTKFLLGWINRTLGGGK
jgi:lysozyme family protein